VATLRRIPRPAWGAAAIALAAVAAWAAWTLTRSPRFQAPASVAVLARSLDREIPAAMREGHVPAAAVAVVRGGRVAWTRGYGTLGGPGGARVTSRTPFQAASVSKPVSAMGVLRLVDEGRLDLDAPMTAWRPAGGARGITVRRLLSHTAGLSLGGYGGHGPGPLPTIAASLAGDSAGAGAVRQDGGPGSHRYSGGGYSVLQLLVERAAGRPFAAWMDDAVLRPLRMTTATFDPAVGARRDVPRGHDARGAGLPDLRYAEQAAAGLWASAEDLGRFVAALLPGPGGAPPGRSVVGAPAVRAMGTAATGTDGAYGLGLELRTLDHGRRMWHHPGVNRGWRAHVAAFPDDGWGLAVVTNGDGGERVTSAALGLLVAGG
jgi:CubicO group peptidase (beta-lactamase class C family)